MFRFAETSVWFEGISRFLRESAEARSSGKRSSAEDGILPTFRRTFAGKPSFNAHAGFMSHEFFSQRRAGLCVPHKTSLSTPGRSSGCPEKAFLKVWAFTGSGLPFLHARLRLCVPRTAFSQRSGPPGRFRAARPTVISSRDSLAALNAMTVVQVPRPYSVSGADGRGRHSGEGKCQARRDKKQKDGRRRPKIVLFPICPDPDYPGFFCRFPAPENAISESSEKRCCRMRLRRVRKKMSTKRMMTGNMSKKRQLSRTHRQSKRSRGKRMGPEKRRAGEKAQEGKFHAPRAIWGKSKK